METVIWTYCLEDVIARAAQTRSYQMSCALRFCDVDYLNRVLLDHGPRSVYYETVPFEYPKVPMEPHTTTNIMQPFPFLSSGRSRALLTRDQLAACDAASTATVEYAARLLVSATSFYTNMEGLRPAPFYRQNPTICLKPRPFTALYEHRCLIAYKPCYEEATTAAQVLAKHTIFQEQINAHLKMLDEVSTLTRDNSETNSVSQWCRKNKAAVVELAARTSFQIWTLLFSDLIYSVHRNTRPRSTPTPCGDERKPVL